MKLDFYTLPPDKKQEYIKKMRKDPALYAKIIHRNLVYDQPMANCHHKLYKAIYERPKRLAAILPRGWSKTTILSTIGCSYDLAYDLETFIVMIKKTYDQAMWDLDNIRSAVIYNDRFEYFFGKFHIEKLTRDRMVLCRQDTKHRTTIVSLGSEQDVRGRLSKNQRISKLLLDDIESEKNTNTEFQRAQIKKHVYSNAMPGLEPRKGKVWAIGTIVHYDSWLCNLLENWRKGDKTWDIIFEQARDKEGNSTFPSRFSNEKLDELEKEYAKIGVSSLFYQEYMNIPIADSDRDFPSGLINSHAIEYEYYYENNNHYIKLGGEKILGNLFMGIDPSTGMGKDFTGFCIVLISKENRAYVLQAYRKKLRQFEIMDEVWQLSEFYHHGFSNIIAEEVAAFKWLREAYDICCRKYNRWLPWDGCKADMGTGESEGQGKRRIKSLAYRFRADALWLHKNQIDLIEELLNHPKAAFNDIADALAYATHPDYTYPPSTIKVLTNKIKSKFNKRKTGIDWMTGAPY